MNRSKMAIRALVVAAAAALAASIGLASPALATYSNGCTVTPITPYHNGDFDLNGTKQISYDVDVTCQADLYVTIEQERWEYDPNDPDDLIGTSTLHNDFAAGADSLTRRVVGDLPDTDDFTDHYEEMYQRVRFKVTNGPVTSAFTAWQYSGTRSIHV